MLAGILDSVPSLIRELAEVHLPCVARKPQHVNVGARTKNPRLVAGDDDARHFRMFESNPLKRIMQLDVYAEIVRVQFELVTRTYPSVLLNTHHKSSDSTLDGQFPVAIVGGRSLEIDEVGICGTRLG